MKIKIRVSDFVEDEDGGYSVKHYIEEREVPDDQVREDEICTICGFPDYPQCKKTCHNFRDKDEEAVVKELENLLRGIWDDDEFVTDVISSVCEVHQEEEMIRFIKESKNPTSDVILMYTTDLQQGNIGD
ncbi:MAG: hypothetical protein IJG23_04815 [Clostridia bacterium]|nr:hypothetical protein [Clostridia bacterium]